MKLNDFFDKIFLVNLERRPDRLKRFEDISNIHDFNFQLFKAYDGQKIDENFCYNGLYAGLKPGSYYNQFDNYARGQMGCILSHLEILKIARLENLEKILILEDDCSFTEKFDEKFNTFMLNFNKSWDMIYFSGSLLQTSEKFNSFEKLISCHTTHSYAVHRNSYDKIIDFLENNIYTMPVDVCYSKIQSSLNCYITMPFLCYQSDGFSDIQNKDVSYDTTKRFL